MKKLYSVLSRRYILLMLTAILLIFLTFSALLVARTTRDMEDTLNSAARYSGQLVNRMIEEASASIP